MTYAQLFISLFIYSGLLWFFIGAFCIWWNENPQMQTLQKRIKGRIARFNWLDSLFLALFLIFSLIASLYYLGER